MNRKILFVDDDQALLNTMERNLCLDYQVVTADGCAAAIEVIKETGPFSVVVVDMQMPRMNGIETIAELRPRLPDAVFLMLTGNQDQTTAVRAVNDGQVFQFLNKPCNVKDISAALQAAGKQHDLIVSEKELLVGTLTGSINLMTDIIEMDGSRRIDTRRMSSTVGELFKQLGLDLGWQERVAARICLVGVALLEPKDLRDFDALDPLSSEHLAIVERVFRTSSKMIAKIPRLGTIAELLRSIPTAESYSSKTATSEVSAICLRVGFYWNYLTLRGLSAEETISTLRRLLPELNRQVFEAFAFLDDNRDAHALISVNADDLVEGMVPNEDYQTPQGKKIFSGGKRLTMEMIENLSRVPSIASRKIVIVANSCPQFAHV
ncbi:MAG: response regulator [Rubripirellula sp.]